jgi:uncharacterized membrane protein
MKASRQFWWAIGATILVAVLLFIVGAFRNGTLNYWYLPYNLALAAIPLGLAYWGRRLSKKYTIKSWRPIVVFILWLLFLPNSFYIVTDFIHLPETARVDLVQDSVMIMLYSMLGTLFGFMSLFVAREQIAGHITAKATEWGMGAILLLSSFAIYLGRELRWNSWDIVANPLGLIMGVVDIVIHPSAHPGAFWITSTFFISLMVVYVAVKYATRSVADIDK